MHRLAALLIISLVSALWAGPSLAQAEPSVSGLPIPRFVSLRADEVNVRTGPGSRYPVEWIYQRRNMPVEVIAEFDVWRRVRDWQGTEGWVNKAMLSSRRTVIVVGEVRALRRDHMQAAAAVARVEPGVIARILKCDGEWCKVEAGGYEGWIQRTEIWGTHTDETIE
jgi:SH3-like domain-containing protein